MEVISRKEAKEKGLKRYFTGKPCKHGHVSERYVVKGRCYECEKERGKEYYDKNKERAKEYYKENKDRMNEYQKEYMREWYDKNPLQAFTRGSLERIEKAIEKERINRAEVELGYTQDQFKHHIESQFKDGMSWDNRSEFHIDHIKPIKAFIDEGITDPNIINALDNLQPLWAADNLRKGAKYEE